MVKLHACGFDTPSLKLIRYYLTDLLSDQYFLKFLNNIKYMNNNNNNNNHDNNNNSSNSSSSNNSNNNNNCSQEKFSVEI